MWAYRYLFKSPLSLLLGIHPEGELLDPTVIQCLIFKGTAMLFSVADTSFINVCIFGLCVLFFSFPSVKERGGLRTHLLLP